jgi:Uma2 family endonuclease
MTAIATIKDQLLSRPDLPRVVQELLDDLEQERLKRNAFYEWVTPDMKAEFINGEIIEHSPASDGHNTSRHQLAKLTSTFVFEHDLGESRDEKAMIRLPRNDYEPDVVFWKKTISAHFIEGQTHYPTPNWVVEILSEGTAKRDRGIKFEDYAANGIQEYWIIDPKNKMVEQYFLEGEVYVLHKKLGMGDHLESKVIQGFAIPVAAIFDKKANHEALLAILSK